MSPLAKKLRVAVLHPSIVRSHLREIALEQFQALLARRGYELRYARGDQQSETSKVSCAPRSVLRRLGS
jgi:hypothetical protein